MWAEERREKICRRCFLTLPFKSLNISTLRKYFHSIYLRFLHFFSLFLSLSIPLSLSLSLYLSLSLCISLPLCLAISRHHKTSQLIFLHIIFLTNGKLIFHYYFCLNSLILSLFFLSISPFLYFFYLSISGLLSCF